MAATEAYRHDYAFTCIGEGTSNVIDRGAFIVAFTLQRETQWRERPKGDFEREARFVIKSPKVPFGEEYTCSKPPAPALNAPEFNPTIEVCGGFTGVPCP